MRTKPCDARVRRGRLDKANQLMDAADTIRDVADEDGDVGDAYVTLCVHAGIAAADVLRRARLGTLARDEDQGS